jgi:SecD/SecF fusion protein
LIELPGVKEPERVNKLLSGTAKLEFYETYDNTEVAGLLSNIDSLLAAKNKTAADTTKAYTAKAGSKALITLKKLVPI